MSETPMAPDGMMDAGHWLERTPYPDEVLLTAEQARARSARWEREVASLSALPDYPAAVSREELARMLAADRPPEGELFDAQGKAVDARFWRAQTEECALPEAGSGTVAARFGFTVRRTDVRRFPTARGVFYAGQEGRLDRLQETAWPVFEPLVILHRSLGGRFVYAQGRNYRGWVGANDVGETDRETFRAELAALGAGRHATVVEPTAEVRLGSGEVHAAEFAARLPLQDGSDGGWAKRARGDANAGAGAAGRPPADRMADIGVRWPVRDPAGRLQFVEGSVKRADARRGGLPCTRRSLVTQAFKLLGEPYGWGGAGGLHDCSSFVLDVYRSVGLDLPRNADEQEAVPGVRAHRFDATDDERSRISVLSGFRAGDVLFMPGHTMVLLGVREGRAYVIHDYGGYAVADGSGAWTDVSVQAVGVMPLDFHLRDGRTYIEALTSAVAFTGDARETAAE